MARENGSIIGEVNNPTSNVASGIWTLNAISSALRSSLWPSFIFSGQSYTVIQTFTSSTTWVCPAGVTEVEYLVVAGGGAGGFNLAGGGGAGGLEQEQGYL